jgi:hypothetical protein
MRKMRIEPQHSKLQTLPGEIPGVFLFKPKGETTMKKILIISDYDKFIQKMKEKTLDLIDDFPETLNNDLSSLFFRDLKIKISEGDISEMISDSEINTIANSYIKKIDGQMVVKRKDLDKCVESLRERFASNLVLFLVKNNYVEQAYDEEQNNFCFF